MKKKLFECKPIILFVLICTLLVFVNVGVVHVFAESDVPCEQKVYWEWDNEKTDDIDVESLLVVIDKYHSDVNKIHTNAFFGNFEKTYITDLTAIEGDIETLKYLNKDNFRQIYQVGLPKECGVDYMLNAISALYAVDGIKFVCPNYMIVTESAGGTEETDFREATRSYYTRDDYWNQWGLERIEALEAQEIVSTLEQEEVAVGIIDSGIAEHDELNVGTGRHFFSESSISEQIEYDNNTEDTDGHGTVVAGLVNAVCPGVKLVPIKIDEWWCNIFVAALSYAIQNNIAILNCSGNFGFEGGTSDAAISEGLYIMANAINNYNGLVVASAGNYSSLIPSIPGAFTTICDNVISVGGTKANSDLCAEQVDWEGLLGSCYGVNTVNLFAPGTEMVSTNNENGYNSGAYGTSFSAPLVAGAVALIKSVASDLTVEELKTVILDGVDEVAALSDMCSTGGRLNVYNSLKLVYKAIYFNFSGGTNGTEVVYVRTDDEMPEIDYPNRTGYTFSHYYDSNGNIYYNGDSDIFTGTQDLNLYAQWSPKRWTLTIQTYIADTEIVDGSTVEMVYDQPHPTYGTQVTAPDIEGYTFVEWRKYYAYFQLNDESIYTSYTEKTVTIYNVLPSAIYGDQLFFTAVYQPACIAEGTLITLADGSQKAVEDLTGDEMLLVWDLYTGTFGSAPILCIDSDPVGHYQVIQLSFSDGTAVDVISEHGFFDIDLNKYVYLDEYAAEYIGHAFWKQGENGMTAVTLVDVEISTEVTVAYSPVTYGHLCYYVNGMLSMPGGIGGLFNIFEIDAETMKYDAEAMAADIEEYGLYTYEELNALVPVPEVMFDAVNGQYLKVAVGKGIVTLEEVGELVEQYGDLFA